MILKITDTHRGGKSCDEDDTSMASTISVEGESSTKEEEEWTTDDDDDDDATNSSSRRSVRFCTAKNESFSNTVICEEDVFELWYKSSDLRHFRSFTSQMAKEINKAEERSRVPLSFEQVMTHTYLACVKATSEQGNVLTADEFEHLVRWANASRFGMEKWSIRPIAHDRSYRKSLIRDMVMEAQNHCQCDFFSMDLNVADSCADISRPLRLFSRTLAEAQAAAIRNDLS
jgi:hypothetical protein